MERQEFKDWLAPKLAERQGIVSEALQDEIYDRLVNTPKMEKINKLTSLKMDILKSKMAFSGLAVELLDAEIGKLRVELQKKA